MGRRPAVLVIAGSDSSGGAGLARDLATLQDYGVEALCALTAVTAQSHSRFWSVHHVPAQVVRTQILAAFESRPVAAVKIGMLGTAATVNAVADSLARDHHDVPIVLDPVLHSSSGGVLLDAQGRAAMCSRLFPLTTVLTPNIPEAAFLADGPGGHGGAHGHGADGHGADGAMRLGWARSLLEQGPRAVLIKGGHASGREAADLLASADGAVQWFRSPRLEASLRGTGCALASAIAAELAGGQALHAACEAARAYVLELLSRSVS